MLFFFFILSTALLASANPVVKPEFEACQEEYDSQIGHLFATAGTEGVTSMWNFMFGYLDIDGNGKLTASEVAVRMEKENLIGEGRLMAIIKETERWISTADSSGNHYELDIEHFRKLIRDTLGLSDAVPDQYYKDAVTKVCQLFVGRIPELSWAMHDLTNCTKSVKQEEKALLDLGSEKVALNTWYAVFNTIDTNNDGIVELNELKNGLNMDMNEENDNILNEVFTKLLAKTSSSNGNITEPSFYKLITKVIFGSEQRETAWSDCTSVAELHGRQYFCHVVRKYNHDIIVQRKNNADCTRVYDGVAKIVLGADRIYAPEIIFTMADINRDGYISAPEYESFAGELSPVFDENTEQGMNVEYFTSISPDHIKSVIDITDSENGTKLWQLSRMSLDELIGEEKLCDGMIEALKVFPHRPEEEIPYPTRGPHQPEVDQEEISEQNFEAEWEFNVEHVKKSSIITMEVEEQPKSETVPTEFPAEEPTEPTEFVTETIEVTEVFEIEETTGRFSTTDEPTEAFSESTEEPTENMIPAGLDIEKVMHDAANVVEPTAVEGEAHENTSASTDEFGQDINTVIKFENNEPTQSEEEVQLLALLEQMHQEEEQQPTIHEAPEHENLLNEDEELQLQKLLAGIFNTSHEKEEPTIEK